MLLAASGAGAQPANDDCAAAIPIGALPFTDAADTTDATTEAGDPTFDCDTNSYGQQARSVWYSYTSASGGPIAVDTFGSDYDTVVTVWRGTCGSLPPLASCNDDDWDAASSSAQSRLVVTLAAGETVYVEVASKDPAGGNLALQVAASSAFQVTDEPSYRAQRPDAAAGADGTFVVVWEDHDTYQIVGRRFCDIGAPLGSVFPISGAQDGEEPRIVRSGSDGFVVVWLENSTLQGRRLSASGVPSGAQFEVAADYPEYFDFGLAGDPTGHFVVTWDSFGADGSDLGIVARLFDSTNALVDGQFVVNTYTTGPQFRTSVASDGTGNFVVTWESNPAPGQDGSGSAIIGRRYDASGAALGGEFQVNVATTNDQTHPTVTRRDGGEFVIVWQDEYNSCTNCVVGRRFDAAGTPQGGEFVVSDGTSAPPSYYVSIDADTSAAGNFTVAWADENDFPWARSFQDDGTPVASAFNAGFVEDDYQRNARVAVAGDGDFVVVWDWAPQGSNYKIMAHTVTQNPSCPGLGPCPPSPRLGCKQPTIHLKGNLTLKDKTPDDRDGVTWKWVNGEATSPAEIGDALATDSYSFCLYDGNGGLLAASTVPPGGTCGSRPCWKDLDGLGFKYADRAGTADDVRKLLVKSGAAGKAKVIVKVQGESLVMPAFPPALPLRAQLASTTDTCWESEFQAEGVTKSTSVVFAAKPSVE